MEASLIRCFGPFRAPRWHSKEHPRFLRTEATSFLPKATLQRALFLSVEKSIRDKSEHQGAHKGWQLGINATVVTVSDRGGKMFKVGEFTFVLPN